MDNEIKENILVKKINNKYTIWIVCSFTILFLIVSIILSSPQDNKDEIIHISPGQSVSSITLELKDKKVIRNENVLRVFIKVLKKGKGIVSGDYLFYKNTPVWKIAWQLGTGHHNIEPIKITIREGLNNEEIASLLSSKLSNFNKEIFLKNVENKQGYLFPDTYFVFGLDTEKELVEKLSNNFENRIKDIKKSLASSNKTLEQIIIMASILEGEASGANDAGTISGILWKRISIGMPLQVDVDKSTYDLKGLPIKPLNNPGLSSIKAALNPVESSYLYYIHDKNGNVHYASSFDEHKRNIAIYLK